MPKPETLKIDDIEYVRKDSGPASIKYENGKHGPWRLGEQYLIRTVTMIQHGTLVDVTEHELVLVNAAWIADTGRFASFLAGKCKPNEVEPFPANEPVIVGRGSIIDAVRMPGQFKEQI